VLNKLAIGDKFLFSSGWPQFKKNAKMLKNKGFAVVYSNIFHQLCNQH
jgi:hypothetical protein